MVHIYEVHASEAGHNGTGYYVIIVNYYYYAIILVLLLYQVYLYMRKDQHGPWGAAINSIIKMLLSTWKLQMLWFHEEENTRTHNGSWYYITQTSVP